MQSTANSAEQSKEIADYKQKCKEIVSISPILQLEVISSASLPKG
jgi:hypothetical protein